MADPDLSIVIPCFNERRNLSPLLEETKALCEQMGWAWEIIVVDDGSTDGTGQWAEAWAINEPNVYVIRRRGDRGLGRALRAGTHSARGTWVLWLMGDRSDTLDTLPLLVQALESGADLVLASRYMPGGSRGNLGRVKAFLSSRCSVIARWVLGVPVHDITNAFRAFRREIWDVLTPSAVDFAISPELVIRAHLAGYQLGQVPTSYRDRLAGRSSFDVRRMVWKYLKVMGWHWWHRRTLRSEFEARRLERVTRSVTTVTSVAAPPQPSADLMI